MRTALTIGIQKDGTAEIIHHPNVGIQKQRQSLHELAGQDKYEEIQYWESGNGMRRIRKTDTPTGINFNAAHLVEHQQDADRKLPDLTPKGDGKEGVVNFNAAHPVEQQQDKKKAKNLPDLTPATNDKPGVVNFETSKLLPDDSKKTNVGVKTNLPAEHALPSS